MEQIMDFVKAAEKRKTIILKMVDFGFSTYDIARFYEVRPSVVATFLKRNDIKPPVVSKTPVDIERFLEKRNEVFRDAMKNGGIYGFFEDVGFLDLRGTNEYGAGLYYEIIPLQRLYNDLDRISKDAIDVFTGESLDPEEQNAVENLKKLDPDTVKDMRDRYGSAEVRRFAGIGVKNNNERSLGHDLNFRLFLELYADGWTNRDISRYTGVPQNLINEYRRFTERTLKMDFERFISKDLVLQAFQGGLKGLDVAVLSGWSASNGNEKTVDAQPSITELRKENAMKGSNPYEREMNKEMRITQGEIFFNLWTKNGLTQKEIGEQFGISREKVTELIAEYRSTHPKENLTDRTTTLSRRRNVNEVQREKNRINTEAVLNAWKDIEKQTGKRPSMQDIRTKTGLSVNIITHILEVNGLSFRRFSKAENDIKQRRHHEMAKAVIGKTTSEIMSERFGGNYVNDNSTDGRRKRQAVLDDQRITRNFLNNMPEAKQRVIDHRGEIEREEMLDGIDEEELIEM